MKKTVPQLGISHIDGLTFLLLTNIADAGFVQRLHRLCSKTPKQMITDSKVSTCVFHFLASPSLSKDVMSNDQLLRMAFSKSTIQ